MQPTLEPVAYASVFMDKGWITQRYQGWQCWQEGERVRALVKRSGPVSRHLILSYRGLDEVEEVLRRRAPWASGAKVTFKWFAQACDGAPSEVTLSGHRLQLVPDRDRTFNKYTFVLDLHASEEQLLAGFTQATRKNCKVAESKEARFETVQDPHAPAVDRFIEKLAAVYRERGLQMLDPALMKRLLSEGAGKLHVVSEQGQEAAMVFLYQAGETVYYLYGVSVSDHSQGGGHFIHWACMRHYKALGCRWYDFGGVSSLNNDNGIFRFKRSFGGQLVDLGAEYRWQGKLLGTAMKVRERLQAMKAGA
jgi:hypothetical protein